jgi:hypothetical protein
MYRPNISVDASGGYAGVVIAAAPVVSIVLIRIT